MNTFPHTQLSDSPALLNEAIIFPPHYNAHILNKLNQLAIRQGMTTTFHMVLWSTPHPLLRAPQFAIAQYDPIRSLWDILQSLILVSCVYRTIR